MQIHLIANAHLDPVWLWDWREGMNEGLTTVRTILDLMEEDPELKFIRGEAVIYQHIEETDPVTFRRIQAMAQSGRWDVVGGTWLQPDTNLTGTETLARHFTRGQRYFHSRFGRYPTAAWQADSFGHTAGLPEILAAAGIDSFAFTRPNPATLPLPEPAFWWEGQAGSRILAYRPSVGWYGTNRDEMPVRLDALMETARRSGLETVGCFYGLGNHGGGPSRRQLTEIRKWAQAHPEIEVRQSGLHEFFAALKEEIARKGESVLPMHRGELNFCLRGCYSSAARVKFLYRRCEELLNRAEKTDSAIAARAGRAGKDLTEPWDGVLFNSFHDILPGSGIERALADQIAWMGGVLHSAQRTELLALNELASAVDTRVRPVCADHPSGVALLVWNPHPYPFRGHVEMETCLDYRPIYAYKDRAEQVPLRIFNAAGRELPFQKIAAESKCMTDLPWRQRVVVPVDLPPLGWSMFDMAWVEGARKPQAKDPVRGGTGWIDNGLYRVEAKAGRSGVRILHRGQAVFGSKGLGALVIEDPWGSWGGMLEQPDSIHLNTILERWTISSVRLLEDGPERARLWMRLSGAKSRIELTFSLCRNREAVDVAARVFWDERSARLKLDFPAAGETEFEVPGATVTRKPDGEVPGGRWVRVSSKQGGFGFASDALYNFSSNNDGLQATVVRATRYADEYPAQPDDDPWRPILDTGELAFQFLLAPGDADLPCLARELEQPPVVLSVTPRPGPLPRSGSLASLHPSSLQLLALKRSENGKGFILRVQAPAGKNSRARLAWMGQEIALGPVRGGKILSWHLRPTTEGWKADRVDLLEQRKKTGRQKSA